MWCIGITVYIMEESYQRWIHNEEGMTICLQCISLTGGLLQLSCIALERSAEKRADFGARIGTYEPHQLVFVDESAVDRRTTYRGCAWAIHGRKATRKAFFCRGRRSVSPIIHYSWTHEYFY